jgi:hypothetical protein
MLASHPLDAVKFNRRWFMAMFMVGVELLLSLLLRVLLGGARSGDPAWLAVKLLSVADVPSMA